MNVKFADDTVYQLSDAEGTGIAGGRNAIKLTLTGGSFEAIKTKFLNPREYELEEPPTSETSIDLTEFSVLHDITYQGNGVFVVTMAQKTAEEKIQELQQEISNLNVALASVQSGGGVNE